MRPLCVPRYAALDDLEAESSAMALAGGRLAGIHWMHDKSREALLAASGCTVHVALLLLASPCSPLLPPTSP